MTIQLFEQRQCDCACAAHWKQAAPMAGPLRLLMRTQGQACFQGRDDLAVGVLFLLRWMFRGN